MKKVLKKVMVASALALSLTTIGGTIIPALGPVEAKASNLNYHTDYANLQMQTIYTQGDQATIVVNVGKDLFENGGVTLECSGNTGTTSFNSSSVAGTKDLGNGNSVTSVYNSDTGKYVVTFTIYRNTIVSGSRAYFYLYQNVSGVIMDVNGGYGYQLW